MDDDTFFIPIVFLLLFLAGFAGYALGHEYGTKDACKSIKSEWVEGKCMKVTREEVK